MTRDSVLGLIDHYGLTRFRDQLERHLRPSVRIRTERFPYDASRLGSKFGGLPLLPEGVPWPMWDARGWSEMQVQRWCERITQPRPHEKWVDEMIVQWKAGICAGPAPLAFIGQIQMDEVPDGGLVGLPAKGRLLFFYDVENSPGSYDPAARRAGQVVYVPNGEGAVRRAPKGLDQSAMFRAASMTFETEWTLPDNPEEEGIALNRWMDEEGRYGKLLEEMYGNAPVMHRLGGNAQPMFCDMRLDAEIVANGIWCMDPLVYRDLELTMKAGAAEWVLLLQVDTDEDGPGWMWGEGGRRRDVRRLYYWIRRQDLRALDFDGVWCSQQ